MRAVVVLLLVCALTAACSHPRAYAADDSPNAKLKEAADPIDARGVLSYKPRLDKGADTRKTLGSILAQPEYLEHQKPAQETWLSRLAKWLGRILSGMGLTVSSGAATVATVLIVMVVLLLVFILARYAWQYLSARGVARQAGAQSEEALGVEGWLKLAREAEARGELRQAVRYRFKAVVSRLELPSSAVLTNYQLARHVSREHPRATPAFARLVGLYEDVWYGGQECSRADCTLANELASSVEALFLAALEAERLAEAA